MEEKRIDGRGRGDGDSRKRRTEAEEFKPCRPVKEWWRSYRSHLSNEPFFVPEVRNEELGLMWCLTAAKSTPIKSMAVHPLRTPLSWKLQKTFLPGERREYVQVESGWNIYIYIYTDRILYFIKSARKDRISVSVIRFLRFRNVWLFDLQIQKVTEIGGDDLFAGGEIVRWRNTGGIKWR